MNQTVRETICDMGYDDAIVFDNPDYDKAIVGITDEGRVIYDFDLMVRCLVDQGMSELEAIDFIEYNTIRALPYAGDNPPIIMNRIPTIDIVKQ